MGLDAIILAGAKNNGRLTEVSNEDYEALIKLNGKLMVEYLIDTLKQVELIDKIILVGPSELAKSEINTFVPCQDSLLKNIEVGLKMANSPYSLIVTSDIPLITVEAIEAFLAQCESGRAAFYYPIVPQNSIQTMFPESKRTYFNLKEGSFSGGNLFLVNGEIVLQLEKFVDKILKWRKNPWKLAYLLGFKFIIKLLTGNLSINLIEEEVYKLIGYKGKAIVLNYPEIGFDIDKPEQFALVEEYYRSSDIKISRSIYKGIN